MGNPSNDHQANFPTKYFFQISSSSLKCLFFRVLVLDKGEVAEIGGVEQLMTKEDGLLRAMMLDAGLLKAEQNKEAGERNSKLKEIN